MPVHRLVTALIATLMVACATAPEFDTSGVDTALNPQAATERTAVGERVLWGGIVQAGRNDADRTVLEVVGYPLGSNRRPETSAQPTGRFLVEKDGYLELADYGAGQRITVTGPVRRVETGKVGDASYLYPVVGADQLHVWSPDAHRSSPSFHIGVGIILGN